MPLRCLLFSSDEAIVQPILHALTELGIEGEHCRSAVDAVERVTTQLFQIVITDWEDQPEAAFLLKTARDLKAAQRPLTLAIVSDDARLPEALRAGANSILLRPIRAEQVRDTMKTACELLRSKMQASSKPVVPQEKSATAAMAAAAGAASLPSFVTQAPENAFRAGEFLQSPSSTPGAQYDTESEVQKALDEVPADEVDALSDLEPTAASVQAAAAEEPGPEPAEPRQAMTGWAALQSRLAKAAPQPAKEASPKNELLSYGETASYAGAAVSPVTKKESQEESRSEAGSFDDVPESLEETAQPLAEPRSQRGRIFLVGTLAVICAVAIAVPRTRRGLQMLSQAIMVAGGNWLNPPPARMPQAVVAHDSFGQAGDEYKLPAPGNIPDATTDPSQIRVLPVVDPTAKPQKGAEANSGQATTGENSSPEQTQNGQSQGAQGQADGQSADTTATIREGREKVTGAPEITSVSNAQETASVPAPQTAAPTQHPVAPPVPRHSPQPQISASNSAGIPPSLKSQIASSTPQAGGAMPPEAAMASIEPVSLPEATARELLSQPVDPQYPAAAKAGGQRGSVVLQVLIGRDGAVRDAKFLQGSLVFARAAIDAVKQWRFKPYLMNGRPVSVQTAITLNFKPPV
jgi:TonB family protein